MKITNSTKQLAIKLILSGIFSILGFLAGSIYSEALPVFLPVILQAMSKTLILKLLLGAIIVCVLLLALSFVVYFHFKTKLETQFGVSWDKYNEPYCPIHEKPFSRHQTKINENRATGLRCVKCNETYHLISDEANKLTLPEAKKLRKSIKIT
jgi:hypothetical protein